MKPRITFILWHPNKLEQLMVRSCKLVHTLVQRLVHTTHSLVAFANYKVLSQASTYGPIQIYGPADLGLIHPPHPTPIAALFLPPLPHSITFLTFLNCSIGHTYSSGSLSLHQSAGLWPSCQCTWVLCCHKMLCSAFATVHTGRTYILPA